MLYIDDDIMTFDLAASLGDISEQRREQALRFKHELGQRQCVASYLLLKKALKEMFGIDANPQFDYLGGGKPVIHGHPDIHFNISHCKTAVAVAVDSVPVGVDIETVRPYKPRLAQYVLSQAELAQVEASEHPDVEFIKLWTRKEALLKLTGEGIRGNLQSVETTSHAIETTVNTDKGYVCSFIKQPLL